VVFLLLEPASLSALALVAFLGAFGLEQASGLVSSVAASVALAGPVNIVLVVAFVAWPAASAVAVQGKVEPLLLVAEQAELAPALVEAASVAEQEPAALVAAEC